MYAYNDEWKILVSIAKGDVLKVKEILNSNCLNWGELIEQSMRHKMFPMVCHEFLKDDELFSRVPPFINQYFKICYDINSVKTRIIKNEAIEIDKLLEERNIPCVATKGIILDNLLYENGGYRFLSDVDFMTLPQFKNDVANALGSLSFQVGTVDWRYNCVREMDREEYLRYVLSKDKLPEHVKRIENSIIKYVSVGFVSSFTWEKCEYTVDMEEAFRSVCRVAIDEKGNTIRSLGIAYHFIYIILHLYKHAWVEFLSKWNNDVNLVKFADVYRYWNLNKKILINEMPDLMRYLKIEEPVLWTLHHTDQVFGSHILCDLNCESFSRDKCIYINSASDSAGKVRYWKGDMMGRLFSKNREQLFFNKCEEI